MATKPIVIAYIPEHLQQRIPGHQHQPRKSEVQTPQYIILPEEAAREQQERNKRIAIGVSIGVVGFCAIAVVTGFAVTNAIFDDW